MAQSLLLTALPSTVLVSCYHVYSLHIRLIIINQLEGRITSINLIIIVHDPLVLIVVANTCS